LLLRPAGALLLLPPPAVKPEAAAAVAAAPAGTISVVRRVERGDSDCRALRTLLMGLVLLPLVKSVGTAPRGDSSSSSLVLLVAAAAAAAVRRCSVPGVVQSNSAARVGWG
jgi:hypothetical protein